MANLLIGFLAGALAGAGGVAALMYRDWLECKRVSRLMIERLNERRA